MKYLISLILIFGLVGLVSICYADRVCLEKSTEKLIEYQSGDAPLGTLTQNAINGGYKKEDVEEKYVTQAEWEVIKHNWITKPAQEKVKQKEEIRKQKEVLVKQKFNLTDDDLNNLREVILK